MAIEAPVTPEAPPATVQQQQHDDDTSSVTSSGILVVEDPMTRSVDSVGSFVVVPGGGENAQQQGEGVNQPLTIPLDSAAAATPVKRVTVDGVIGDSGVAGVAIKRRDSLKSRESFLRGKVGSRRRQRWENDHFLNHPQFAPPEPQDYGPQPLYPKRVVRYEFAALWDPTNPKMFGYNPTKPTGGSSHSTSGGGGKQPQVPKNLRDRLKRSEWAVSLLRELEAEVRKYAAGIWGCSAGSSSRCASVSSDRGEWEKEKSKHKRGSGRRKPHNRPRSNSTSSVGSVDSMNSAVSSVDGGVSVSVKTKAGNTIVITGKDGMDAEELAAAAAEAGLVEREVLETPHASEDEEIVFVPKVKRVLSMKDDDITSPVEDNDENKESLQPEVEHEHKEPETQEAKMELEKPVFEAPTGDPTGSFIRWMIHSIAMYYGLRSWSVDVGNNPCMRIAFVGVHPTASTSKKKSSAKVAKGQHLPRELWRML